MPDKTLSLQDNFLNNARRGKLPLTVFLVKGVKLQGVITWFDTFSVLLRREGRSQLVYKHSISTIVTNRPFAPPPGAEAGARSGLQDVFLSAAEHEQQQMVVFLVNGVMLQGVVAGHDQFSLLLERGGQAQLVYKHAVSTLEPEEPLSLGAGHEGGEGKEEL